MSNKCGKGFILREGYKRRGYYNKYGTYIKAVYVPPTCIVDRGKKGKGPRLLPELKKGTLSQYGYHAHLNAQERHKSLSRATRNIPAITVFRKLNAVYVLSRNTNPRVSNIFRRDRDWVKSTFM